jgi:integrase
MAKVKMDSGGYGFGLLYQVQAPTKTALGKYQSRYGRPGIDQESKTFTAKNDTEATHMHHTWVGTARRAGSRTPAEVLAHRQNAKRTVGQLLDEWLEELDLPGAPQRPNTITAHKDRVKCLRPALGHVPLSQLDTQTINDVTRRWLTGKGGRVLKPRTVKATISTLRMALSYGQALGYCTTEAIDRARKTTPTTKVDLIPDSAMRTILAAARENGGTFHLFVELAAATGCRRGEVLGLRWGDIDFKNHTVQVMRSMNHHGVGPVKTDNGYRLLDLPPSLIKLLEARRGAADDDAYIVGLHPATVSRMWRDLCDGLGFAYTPHQVRHSVASRHVNSSIGISEAARIMGDTEQTLLSTYTHKNLEKRAIVTVTW